MYKIKDGEQRYKQKNTCKDCQECGDYKRCLNAKTKLDTSYEGIRFTADGFDCALPVSIDSHSSCSYACLYCFSEFLGGHTGKHGKKIKQYNLDKFERILSGESQTRIAKNVRVALKRDQKQPCAVQVGALCDPFDNIERQQGWALKLAKLAEKYNQPCRISTKGILLQEQEYLEAFSNPNLFWFAFSIITPDDELITKIDKYAPNATERLKAMYALSKKGVSTSLRFRPMIPNVSDRTKNHKYAYRDLIQKAADSGARAVSMEAMFSPGALLGDTKQRWDELHEIVGINLIDLYKNLRSKGGSCNRISRPLVEDIFYECQELTHKNNMTFAVSDPIMKHLNDTGCCCGMLPNDPIWGNWQRENATNAVVEAKEGKEVNGKDYVPEWANEICMRDMCCIVGPAGAMVNRKTWADKLINTWNDLKSNRGALNYFQGILRPKAMDKDKNIVYAYNSPKRQHNKNQLFKV